MYSVLFHLKFTWHIADFFFIWAIYLRETKGISCLVGKQCISYLRTGKLQTSANFNLLTLHNQTKTVYSVVIPYPCIPVNAETTIKVASSFCIVDKLEGLLVLVRSGLCDRSTREFCRGCNVSSSDDVAWFLRVFFEWFV